MKLREASTELVLYTWNNRMQWGHVWVILHFFKREQPTVFGLSACAEVCEYHVGVQSLPVIISKVTQVEGEIEADVH